MMVITQDALKGWLDRLAGEAALIAPRDVDGIALFRPVANSGQILWNYTRTKMSPKEVVFPSTDVLCKIEKRGKDVTLAEPGVTRPQIVFGLRPCDAHGIAVLDAVFIDKAPVDETYAARRAVTTLVGLACPQMWDNCFCTSVGGAPDDASHLDVMLTAVEGGYAVQAVTSKGKALVAGLALREAAGDPPRAETRLRASAMPLDQWPARFGERYWDLLAERCLGCRACGYVCPTCRCFDVRDQVAGRRSGVAIYDRVRGWDTCTSPNYRVVAGGHNSRPTKGQRLRNRFFCKFYYLSQDYGVPSGCVGCGRCIEACPVNVDILEVLNDMARAETGAEAAK